MNNPSISNPPTSFPTEEIKDVLERSVPPSFVGDREHVTIAAGDLRCLIYAASAQLQSTEAVERALRNAREAVASLDEDALGEVVTSYNKHGEPDSGYPIRNELLAEIDAAITALTSPAVVEDPQNADELLAADPDFAMRVGYERRILAAEMDAMKRINGVLDWLKTCIRHARYTPDAIDHKAADTMENIAKRIEEAFADFGADQSVEGHHADVDRGTIRNILYRNLPTEIDANVCRTIANEFAALLVTDKTGVEK